VQKATEGLGGPGGYHRDVPRFSANLHFLFNEHPFLDRFAAAARAGFTAVEFPDPYAFPLAELVARLRANALSCVLLNFPMGDRAAGEMGLACLPERTDEFRATVPRAIAAAQALGCPRLNCMAGRAPAGAEPDRLRATLVDNLRLAAAACAEAGLEVMLEPLNDADLPDIYVKGTAQAVDIIREVGAANLRLQFDCYHLTVMGEPIAATLERLLPLVGHIQIGDVPGRHEPGTGDVRYDQIFKAIDLLGYGGWVGAEYRPSGRTDDSFGWLRRTSE
jgi:hydroxypyruvate isomerase